MSFSRKALFRLFPERNLVASVFLIVTLASVVNISTFADESIEQGKVGGEIDLSRVRKVLAPTAKDRVWKGTGFNGKADEDAFNRAWEKSLTPYKRKLESTEEKVQLWEQTIFQTAFSAVKENLRSSHFVAQSPLGGFSHIGRYDIDPESGERCAPDQILIDAIDSADGKIGRVPMGLKRKSGAVLIVGGSGKLIDENFKRHSGGSELLRMLGHITPELLPITNPSGLIMKLPIEANAYHFFDKTPVEIRKFESGEWELIYQSTNKYLWSSLYLDANHQMPIRLERYTKSIVPPSDLGDEAGSSKGNESPKLEVRFLMVYVTAEWSLETGKDASTHRLPTIVECSMAQYFDQAKRSDSGVIRIHNTFSLLPETDEQYAAFFDKSMLGLVLPPINPIESNN